MRRKFEKEALAAEVGALDALLQQAPEDDLLAQLSLGARRAEAIEQLASMSTVNERNTARVGLVFGGVPVLGSRGIRASFAAEAVGAFETAVASAWAKRQRGDLAATGPIPHRGKPPLHIVGTLEGSFGFELAEIEGAVELEGAPLKEAVDDVAGAMVAAVEGDEALADVAEALGTRPLAALSTFFGVLKRHLASFRVVSDSVDRTFTAAEIDLVVDRMTDIQTTEDVRPVVGELLGVLPDRRTFEFQTQAGDVLRGRIDDAVTNATVRTLNPLYAGRTCVATMRVVTVSSGGRDRHRHVLLAVDAPSSLAGD